MWSILVYSGEGTMYVDVLIKSLNQSLSRLRLVDPFKVRVTTPEELRKHAWLDDCKLLIIPGGRDLLYVRDIDAVATDNIRTFLTNGGSFLGLCAGAYFASSFVCFEQDTYLEVKGTRSLKLFRGTAKGSVYPGFKYGSTSGMVLAPIRWRKEITYYVYFDGGCEFIPDCDFTDYETIGVYEDFSTPKMAIVALHTGKVILSGVHPEMDVDFLDQRQYTDAQWELLVKYQQQSREIFCRMLKSLLK